MSGATAAVEAAFKALPARALGVAAVVAVVAADTA